MADPRTQEKQQRTILNLKTGCWGGEGYFSFKIFLKSKSNFHSNKYNQGPMRCVEDKGACKPEPELASRTHSV